MAARHDETVGKKISRMLAQFILIDNRDVKLTMADIIDGTAESLVDTVSKFPRYVAGIMIPPLARPIMKDKVRGMHTNDMPLLPGFEDLKLGFRFAVPPLKVVEDEVEEIDEKSLRTIWIPRHVIEIGEYRRHVNSYTAQLIALQRETDLRQEVLNTAVALGGDDDELLIDVLGRAME